MSWKLTAWARTREGLAGVPWRDLSDDEYAAALDIYPELGERGYFEPATPAAGAVHGASAGRRSTRRSARAAKED